MFKDQPLDSSQEETRKSWNYRRSLGRYLGQNIVLECSDYRVGPVDEDGNMYMLLRKPSVVKVGKTKLNGEWVIGHLWVQVPVEKVQYIDRYCSLARKMRIKGKIYEYHYSISGRLQAGVKAEDVSVLKFRKDLAKKYNLNPGDTLRIKTMDRIVWSEELQKATEEERGSAEKKYRGKYEVQKLKSRSDKRHIEVMASNRKNRLPMLDDDSIWKTVSSEISNTDEYYVFVKIKTGECLGYGVVKYVDRKTVEIEYELYDRYRGQELETACLTLFVTQLRGEYKTTSIIAKVLSDNTESRRILEHLGGRLIGTEAEELTELMDPEKDDRFVEIYEL